MDFNWAVKQMRLGKKVRREYWVKDLFMEHKGNIIFTLNDLFCSSDKINLVIEDYEANDWELVYNTPKILEAIDLARRGNMQPNRIRMHPNTIKKINSEFYKTGFGEDSSWIFGLKIVPDETIHEESCMVYEAQTLSDKIDYGVFKGVYQDVLFAREVKEFIVDLMKELFDNNLVKDEVRAMRILKELAGEKL